MQTIHEQFIQTAEVMQGKPLFERPGQPAISFAQMRETVEALAGALTAIGVTPGDRVAAQVEKSPEAVALYLATLQVGAIFLPLNTAYTGPEIDYFIGDAAPRLFVCDPGQADGHAHRAGRTLAVETLGADGRGSLMDRAAAATPREDRHPAGPDDRAAILYTSGTTGRSKGAVLTHRNLASNTEALLAEWRFTADDRLIHALPIFHTHGLFVAANMALVAGATMVWLTKFDAEQAIDLMDRATVLMGVPTFYTRLLKSPRLDRDATAHMRLFVSGSAPLLAEDHRAFTGATGHAILERYGMTETCMIASNPYQGDRIPGAVGMALPGIAIRITDRETGAPLPDGQIGLIEVKGPNVFEGYWNMPEKTAAEFREDGYFITGDLGVIGDDGYLRIVGRDKDLVISGGYNVYPKEVEEAIDALPDVLESAVIGLPHPDLGEAVTAVVVPKAPIDEAAIRTALEGGLARFKQPRRVILADALPRNVMGKVQKAELRRIHADLYATQSA
ncbi:malonyl-CoA synthase [Paracoccus aestuarii]|uniref:Malonyl-CoA synthase n=2 Tax=Paracoccus aestuarii TaxID=453842 RepID=A0A419A0T1_9RHOB|nr:malonyl-CoA synthase [Paracoccus aestuarii]RJL06458.1 malonyl-CoA synthase [Paracoccus aestuarii]WCR00578.1 malonyl-CoA synthase [Paracoccus aestuarii]